jgi:hypothetical protein
LTENITVRGIEYPFLSGEAAIDPATKIIWSLLKIASTEAYEAALETKDPVTSWQKLSTQTDTVERNSAFLFSLNLDPEIEPNAAKNPRVALENNLRKLIPSLPTGLGATELIEFINAVLPQESTGAEPQPKKKASKKKNGFGEKSEPELPTLEAIAGREISPEEIAAVKVEGKPLEDAIAAPLIPIPDAELAKLRPDLLTIEEQDLQAALAEQQANRLTVVSSPVPPDADELEDLI